MSKNNHPETLPAQINDRYVRVRRIVDKHADHIIAIAHLLSLLEHCAEESIPVNPKVLASFADTIHTDVCAIIECLDAFAFIQEEDQ